MNWGRRFGRAGIAAVIIACMASPIGAQDYFYRYKGTWGPGGASGGGTTATVNIASNPINPNVNKPFSTALSASGAGIAGYQLNPSVPWLSVSSSAVSGTPSSTGTYKFRVEALNASNDVIGTSDEVTVEVLPPASISFAAGHVFPDLTVGTDANVDFKTVVTVNDLDARTPRSLTWSKTPAGDPPGLTLDTSTGVLSGKPTTAGSYPITVVATGHDATGQQVYTIKVNGVYLDVVKISAGPYHSCAITVSGAAKCWGQGAMGELGDGKKTNSVVPVDVSGLSSGVTMIEASANYTCAVHNGTAKCWGPGDFGRLGHGSTAESLVPAVVVGLESGVTMISLSGNSSGCGVTTAGEARCWGHNGNGQLGDNSTTQRNSSVRAIASGVASISMGGTHTCALMTSGAVKCWGSSNYYQVDGTQNQRTAPVDVPWYPSGVTRIALGAGHTCVLRSTGAMECWGLNTDGQIGNNSTTMRSSPISPDGLSSGVSSIAVSGDVSCAILSAGGAKCWGQNNYGQAGGGTASSRRTVPTDVLGITGITAISPSGTSTCALASGNGYCWGLNAQGQLGDGTKTNSLTPVKVAAPPPAT